MHSSLACLFGLYDRQADFCIVEKEPFMDALTGNVSISPESCTPMQGKLLFESQNVMNIFI